MPPSCAAIGVTLSALLAAQQLPPSSIENQTAVILKEPGTSRVVSLRRGAPNEAWDMMVFRLEGGRVFMECREVLEAPPEAKPENGGP